MSDRPTAASGFHSSLVFGLCFGLGFFTRWCLEPRVKINVVTPPAVEEQAPKEVWSDDECTVYRVPPIGDEQIRFVVHCKKERELPKGTYL